MDIQYCVKPLKTKENKTIWGAYENNRLIKTFVNKERALDYIKYWKWAMR